MTNPEINKIQIEKGVPVPIGNFSEKNTFTATLRSMEVGDSFFKAAESPTALQLRINSCKRYVGEDRKFVTRTREENGVKGVRVWRTA